MMDERRKALVQAYLTGCNFWRFRYGLWDCGLFCADVLRCITDRDVAGHLRGKYRDRKGYLEALPVPLRQVPEHLGLTRCQMREGAVFWMPGGYGDGGLGIVWQGQFLQPWKRGIRAVTADVGTMEFYTLT